MSQSKPEKEFHVGRPNLPDKDKLLKRFSDVINSGWITNDGPLVRELENKIANYLGVKHCICVCNATIGLELVQRALNLSGEVIIPSFTFIATANSLRWQKIDPVFCDIKPEDHLIDPSKIEMLITPRTSAIMAVPIWGQACDYSELEKIAQRHNLKLIFDSAHAFGCKSGDRYIGEFGDAEVFSLHATKYFSTGEGGLITTNSDALSEKLKYMRNFGFDGYDKTVSLGTNAKMSEFTAAYGLSALDNLENVLNQNKSVYKSYLEIFKDSAEIKFLEYDDANSSNFHYIVTRVDSLYRDQIVDYYHQNNIFVRKYFYPGCHRLEPYISDKKYSDQKLPNTEKISSEIIIFPNGNQISEQDVLFFFKKFRNFHSKI
jgi:dTDP-4-amino-4,6-dideoxygalactose transaminase